MMTAAEKRSYLRQLREAMYRGVDYVSYNGDQIKYRSLSDMQRIEAKLVADLGGRNRPRTRRAVTVSR
jgi:hypothetical protein